VQATLVEAAKPTIDDLPAWQTSIPMTMVGASITGFGKCTLMCSPPVF